jgi:hypothetical protein
MEMEEVEYISELETQKKVLKAELDSLKDIIDRIIKGIDRITFDTSNAFVVYDKNGKPLAYFFKTEGEITEREMATIMKLIPKATDNAETYIEWRETI